MFSCNFPILECIIGLYIFYCSFEIMLIKSNLKMAICKEINAHTRRENMLQISWGTFLVYFEQHSPGNNIWDCMLFGECEASNGCSLNLSFFLQHHLFSFLKFLLFHLHAESFLKIRPGTRWRLSLGHPLNSGQEE